MSRSGSEGVSAGGERFRVPQLLTDIGALTDPLALEPRAPFSASAEFDRLPGLAVVRYPKLTADGSPQPLYGENISLFYAGGTLRLAVFDPHTYGRGPLMKGFDGSTRDDVVGATVELASQARSFFEKVVGAYQPFDQGDSKSGLFFFETNNPGVRDSIASFRDSEIAAGRRTNLLGGHGIYERGEDGAWDMMYRDMEFGLFSKSHKKSSQTLHFLSFLLF